MRPDTLETLQIGLWLVEFDAKATRQAYESISVSGPMECTCATCKNWLLVRDLVYPRAFTEMLAQIGIDGTKESEVVSYAKDLPPVNPYFSNGWFHFFGKVGWVGDATPGEVPVGGQFRYSFRSSYAPGPDVFTSNIASRIEWACDVTPWLLPHDEYRRITEFNEQIVRKSVERSDT